MEMERSSLPVRISFFFYAAVSVYNNSPDQPTSQYRFVNRALNSVDGEQDAYVPARSFVETLLKNISIPSLLVAKIPRDQVVAAQGFEQDTQFLYVVILTLDRTNLSRASFQDYEYLKCMLHSFVPRFVIAVSRISDAYLPGDARNLCREIAGLMMMSPEAAAAAAPEEEYRDQKDLHAFLAVYAKRYVHEALTNEKILERCLIHIVKMPFELGSSIRYGLVLY
ncbi:hypothetical protein BJX66DRAFT_319065 [Aspergillus keveii]|uniref:Uncharacterized protein n=1 Tax=Aspergillus keveii TaxID=714993 RepID=A0ABR4FIR8_9EURO